MARPRDTRVDEAILTATRELLAEAGYAGLTMDAVAERARIGKAAIYRRHATKQEMVFSAAVHGADLPDPPDTGSLRGDLVALVREIVDHLTNPAAAAAIPGLMGDLSSSPELAARFQDILVTRQQLGIEHLLDRAVARGELRTAPDVSLVHALVSGPVFAVIYVQNRSPEGLPEQLGTVIHAALAASSQNA
ncbi:TetR/AcrR family transcriptional regulator [Streptomyces sp. NPDC048258]|uniref:TetR/AcrR family transcriptional regulator n=1 Tax=Streptomyces sp. NPDC048258 TaxID=3365527 RepID=UPI00371BE397